jgi:hypothetical protein
MALKKLFLWFSEGLVLLGIVFIVNAQLFMSIYYYTLKALDKIRDLLV